MSGEPPQESWTSLEVSHRIRDSISVKEGLLRDVPAILAVGEELTRAFRDGHKLLLFGNGGSAADAQHIAAEFVGRFYLNRPGLSAFALSVDPSVVTAIGNDFSFDELFARQVVAHGRPGDVAIGLSTSGGSENVARALRAGRERQMRTIALTGRSPGQVGAAADLVVAVPSGETPRIQEAHILLGHIWAEMVEAALFRDAPA